MVERAIDLARRCNNANAEAFAHNARYVVRWSPSNLEERMSNAATLLSRTLRCGDRALEVVCRTSRFCTLLEAADFPMMLLARSHDADRTRARHLMDEASVEARSLGLKDLLDRLAKLPA
jgi:hypothetical protein